MSRKLYTIEETAGFLHVTKWTVYRQVSLGNLKNVRHSARAQFFTREDIEEYARENGYYVEIPVQSQEERV